MNTPEEIRRYLNGELKIIEVYINPEARPLELPKGKKVITMSESSRRKAYALVRSLCANYDRSTGECLPLECDCPQLKSLSLCCKYFQEAVLPAEKELEAEIMGIDHAKTCELCGKPFRALSNAAKYCVNCGQRARRKQSRESWRKKQEKKTASTPQIEHKKTAF